VLEGSVQRSGDVVRVNAQLIDASTGYSLWAEKYDRPMKEIFALQDDISKNVVAALRLTLGASGQAAAGPPTPTPNLEAYDAYLRGASYANAHSWYEKDESIPYFEKTVAIDPDFADAHAALAQQYARKSFESDPAREWERKALGEIEKALTLDPNLAEAYLARGTLTWTIANHFPHEKAAADFRRAIELNPSLGRAHSALASLYVHVGLLDRALEEYRLALRIDPHDLESAYRIPRIHLYQQKYAEALAEFDATPEFRSDFQKPLVLAHLGRLAEAVALTRGVVTNPTHSKQASDVESTRAVLFALSGDSARAQEAVDAAAEGGKGSSHFHHAAYNIACAYALLGRTEEAMVWLRRTADEGMPCYPLFEKDPFLDRIRGDSDFQTFLGDIHARWEHFRTSL
jgi:tetratricopeptide (TPR) repeat protein